MVAIAFVTISNVLALKPLGTTGILSIAFQTPAVWPAAACGIVLAAFRVGLTGLAVF